MRLLIVLILIAVQTSALAEGYAPLAGSYSMGGKTLYDPPSDEQKDTHIYFVLEGQPAKDLYTAMKVRAVRDACTSDGTLSKRIKEMRCTRSANGKDHTCFFGIDLKNQRVTNGALC